MASDSTALTPAGADGRDAAFSRAVDTLDRSREALSDGAAGAAVRQFVSFDIGEEEYGIDIMAVREIKAWTGATRLPHAPVHMRGVINLRGVIVPIFDLRARFGMGETAATEKHVVIIVSVGRRIVGMLVDAVSDILAVTEGEIRPVPKVDRTIDSDFLNGLVSVEERMVALLAVEKLFDLDELADLADAAEHLDT